MEIVALNHRADRKWINCLIEVGKSIGVDVHNVLIENLIVVADKRTTVVKSNIPSDSALLNRAQGIMLLHEQFETPYYILCQTLDSAAFMLNRASVLKYPQLSNKMIQAAILAKLGIPIPETKYFPQKTPLLAAELKFPLVAKVLERAEKSFSGKGVSLVNNIDQLEFICDSSPVLTQPLIKNLDCQQFETRRTIFSRYEIIGSFARESSKDFRTNGSESGRQVKTPIEMDDIVEKIVGEFDLDFGAIDFILKDGQPVVLEVNRFPGLLYSCKVLGPDPVKKMLQVFSNHRTHPLTPLVPGAQATIS